MAYRWRLFLAGVIALAIVSVILPGRVHAAGPALSLTTSPASLDLVVKPGGHSSNILQLMNNSPNAINITMQLKEFAASGSSGAAAISNVPAGDPSASWVHFSPSSFVAQPGVWNSVVMTINLPKTADLGYYYAVVFSPQVPSPTLAPRTAAIKGSNAILVLVDTSSGNESRDISVANFSVNHGIFEYLPVTFNVTVHNSGNIYLPASGNIFVSKHSNFTDPIDTLVVNAGGGNILPQSNRIFQSQWTDGFPLFKPKNVDGVPVYDKQGQPVMTLNWNFSQANKLRFGKYYAQLVVLYNNGNHTIPITADVSFWVIPYKIMIGFLIFLSLIGFGLWTVGRGIYRRIKKVPVSRLKTRSRFRR